MSKWKTFALTLTLVSFASCSSFQGSGERVPNTDQNRTYEHRQRVQLERAIKTMMGKTAKLDQFQMKEVEFL